MKGNGLRIILAGMLLAGSALVFAPKGICGMEWMDMPKKEEAAKEATPAKEEIEEMNKICPVMGGVAQKDVNYEYKGKKYYFCCPACIESFKKDPEKYIKILEDMKKEKKALDEKEHSEHHEGK